MSNPPSSSRLRPGSGSTRMSTSVAESPLAPYDRAEEPEVAGATSSGDRRDSLATRFEFVQCHGLTREHVRPATASGEASGAARRGRHAPPRYRPGSSDGRSCTAHIRTGAGPGADRLCARPIRDFRPAVRSAARSGRRSHRRSPLCRAQCDARSRRVGLGERRDYDLGHAPARRWRSRPRRLVCSASNGSPSPRSNCSMAGSSSASNALRSARYCLSASATTSASEA
jgi:hypothetical protein